MTTARINVIDYVAEYAKGKFGERESGVVKFPPGSDIYVLLYDLMQKRPTTSPVDRGNLEIVLPDRRDANRAGGKSPEQYNYLSTRSATLIETRLRVMMWAELHDLMDENKHLRGINFKETVYMFLQRYGIESLTEDALIKNYQRWRDRIRKSKKRGYSWKTPKKVQ